MKPILVLYAAREGHARLVAAYLGTRIEARGLSADMLDTASVPPAFSLENYSAVIIAASVHHRRHAPEIVNFVKYHTPDLKNMPAAFLSISRSEARAQDVSARADRRTRAAADVHKMIEAFVRETGWSPPITKAVAGTLTDSKHRRLLRFVVKRSARQAGGAADTSKDHVYTDWIGLDLVVGELLLITLQAPTRTESERLAG